MTLRPAVFDRHILSLDVAGFAQSLAERVHKRVRRRAGRPGVEDPDHRYCLLLRPSRERHGEDAPTHHSDERSPVHHSMTWSARPSTDCGIFRPRALAVWRLTTRSNLVGCSMGKSPGFAPFKIFATCPPARRSTSKVLGPYEMRAPLVAQKLPEPVQLSTGRRLFVASSAIWIPCDTRNELGTRTTPRAPSRAIVVNAGSSSSASCTSIRRTSSPNRGAAICASFQTKAFEGFAESVRITTDFSEGTASLSSSSRFPVSSTVS